MSYSVPYRFAVIPVQQYGTERGPVRCGTAPRSVLWSWLMTVRQYGTERSKSKCGTEYGNEGAQYGTEHSTGLCASSVSLPHYHSEESAVDLRMQMTGAITELFSDPLVVLCDADLAPDDQREAHARGGRPAEDEQRP